MSRVAKASERKVVSDLITSSTSWLGTRRTEIAALAWLETREPSGPETLYRCIVRLGSRHRAMRDALRVSAGPRSGLRFIRVSVISSYRASSAGVRGRMSS